MRRLFAAFLLLWPLSAQALDCSRAAGPVEIRVLAQESPIQYDFTQNRAQLNAMGQEVLAASIGGAHSAHVGGLAKGTITSNMGTEIQTLTSANGQACVWVSQIEVRLQYLPLVYISREFAPGTCHHSAVMEHEQKHVMVDRYLLQQFRPDVEQQIRMAAQNIGQRGPIPVNQIEAASRQMQEALEARMNQLMDNLTTVREARQAQIDTPQEYMRVQNLCTNWP